MNSNIKTIFEMFETNGFEIRLVGGCVRDLINKNIPNDFDFATNALPEQIIEIAKKYNLTFNEVGKNHGTIGIFINGDFFEITTLRIDVECFGRKANVEFVSDWKLDAKRRDITINAMSMDKDGNIFDYFNGKNDLENKIIRFVGNAEKRIEEDALRMIRWFRFNDRFGKPENFISDDFKIIQQKAYLIKNVSGERILQEFEKAAKNKNFVEKNGFLEGMIKSEILNNIIGDFNYRIPNFLNNFPAMFGFFFNNKIEEIIEIVKPSLEFQNIARYASTGFLNEKEARILISRNKIDYQSAYDILKIFNINISFENEIISEFPIKGQDLIDIGKAKPGIELGKILKAMRVTWENMDFKPTKAEMIQWLGN